MRNYSWGVALAGWGLLVPFLATTPLPPPAILLMFGLLAIVSEWLMVPLPRGGFQSSGLAVTAAGLVLMGPIYTALVMSVGVVVGNGLLHRRPYLITVFNSGQYILSILLAGAVFVGLHPADVGLRVPMFTGQADLAFLLAFLAGVMSSIIASSLLVSGMVAPLRGARFLAVFRANIMWEFVNNLAFAAVGLVLALIYVRVLPVGAVVLAIPLLLVGYILMLAARVFEASRRDVERLATLQRMSNAIASSLEMDNVLKAIVEGSQHALGVDQCAIFLANEQLGMFEVHAHGLEADHVEALRRGLKMPVGKPRVNFREPLYIEDAKTDRRMPAIGKALFGEGSEVLAWWAGQFRTIMTLPLTYSDEFLGALTFYHDRVRPYSAGDVELAKAIASQAAIAVKNATLLSQARHRAAEADLLNRVLSSVTETLDVQELFRRIVEEVSATFGYAHVSIYRRQGDHLVLQAQVGYHDGHETLHITKGIMARVARTGKPALIPDVTKERDYIRTFPTVQSEVAVPIVVDNQVMGVLNIEESTRQLTQGDVEMLLALARQLGVALGNATLYEEAKRARDELSVLYEAAKTISSTLELDSVLNSLVQVTCEAFGYEYGAILLADDRSGDLVVEATYGYPSGTRGYRVPSGKGVTGWVQRTGKPELVPDVRQDSRYIGVNERVASEIAVPLISEGRVIGVFNLESARRAAFSQRDLEILTALAGYATIAIENARLFEQTKRLAITDGLTELYNHRYLHEALERLLERCSRDGEPLALIMLEVDNFKRYNDTYGHQRGDEVLRIVADLLRKGSRTSDFVARYGGDEFMIVLPNTSKEAALEIAERLRRSVEAYPFLLGENIVTSVTLSVGVAASSEDGDTVDAIVEAVDRAQYTAKRSGGNKVHVAHVYH